MTYPTAHRFADDLRNLEFSEMACFWFPSLQRVCAVGDGRDCMGRVFMWDSGRSAPLPCACVMFARSPLLALAGCLVLQWHRSASFGVGFLRGVRVLHIKGQHGGYSVIADVSSDVAEMLPALVSTVGEIGGHSKKILSCDFKQTRPFQILTASEDFQVCARVCVCACVCVLVVFVCSELKLRPMRLEGFASKLLFEPRSRSTQRLSTQLFDSSKNKTCKQEMPSRQRNALELMCVPVDCQQVNVFNGPPFKFVQSCKEHQKFVNCVRFVCERISRIRGAAREGRMDGWREGEGRTGRQAD